MAFHDEADEAFALVGRLGEELLGRGEDGLFIGADFDLGYGFDGDGYTLLGIEILLRGYVEAHESRESWREFSTTGKMTAPPPLMTRGPRKP